MSDLIDWSTTGAIFVESLVAGVLIVVAFSVAAKMVTQGGEQRASGRSAALSYGIAGIGFLIAALAVAYGVYFTIDK